jgi:hypothetical protein
MKKVVVGVIIHDNRGINIKIKIDKDWLKNQKSCSAKATQLK